MNSELFRKLLITATERSIERSIALSEEASNHNQQALALALSTRLQAAGDELELVDIDYPDDAEFVLQFAPHGSSPSASGLPWNVVNVLNSQTDIAAIERYVNELEHYLSNAKKKG